MKFDVLTLFPEMFPPVVEASIIGRAKDAGLVSFRYVNIRDYSLDRRKRTDDTTFGGGPGMVMTAQPVDSALQAVQAEGKRVIYLSPRGRVIDKAWLDVLAQEPEVVLICGHYEGMDQRVLDKWEAEEVSVGDYVLTGGELPAMILIDAVSRLIPGVLSSSDSALQESVYSGLLEYPQYTRPAVWEGRETPPVLLSGDHRKIHLWRLEEALKLTKIRRPDLFDEFVKDSGRFEKDEQKVVEKVSKLL